MDEYAGLEPHEMLTRAWKKRFKSAAEAAAAYGWNVSTFRSHANGHRTMDADAADRYGKRFNINPLRLLGLERFAGKGLEYPQDGPSTDAIITIISVFLKLAQEAPLQPAFARSLDEIVRQVLRVTGQNDAMQRDPSQIEGALRTIIASLPDPEPRS